MFHLTAAKKLLDELDRLEVPPIFRLQGEVYQQHIRMVKNGQPVNDVALSFKKVVDDALGSVADDNGYILKDNSFEIWRRYHQRKNLNY